MIAYRRQYGLGDAQIDAQNQVIRDIQTPFLDQYAAVKGTPAFTGAFITATMNGIQHLIDVYASQYAGIRTSRGEAGRVTLQNFVDQNLFPAMRADYNSVVNSVSGGDTTTTPAPSDIYTPAPYNPSINYNVEINPGAPSTQTPANFQPSGSPGAPAGLISIPGVEQTVNADVLWYQKPTFILGIGAALWFLFVSKKR